MTRFNDAANWRHAGWPLLEVPTWSLHLKAGVWWRGKGETSEAAIENATRDASRAMTVLMGRPFSVSSEILNLSDDEDGPREMSLSAQDGDFHLYASLLTESGWLASAKKPRWSVQEALDAGTALAHLVASDFDCRGMDVIKIRCGSFTTRSNTDRVEVQNTAFGGPTPGVGDYLPLPDPYRAAVIAVACGAVAAARPHDFDQDVSTFHNSATLRAASLIDPVGQRERNAIIVRSFMIKVGLQDDAHGIPLKGGQRSE